MPTITKLRGLEILDSRGRPTVKAWCTLDDRVTASASVPAGASTGRSEARELRDGEARHAGQGCRQAAKNVEHAIGTALCGLEFTDQAGLDKALVALDGTPDKHRLGANALLATSVAYARAAAAVKGVPFFEHLSAGRPADAGRLPRLTVNLFSGGLHAGGQIPIQDVLVVPVSTSTVRDSLDMVSDVYRAAAELAAENYGYRPLVADEGGLAPPFPDADAMLGDAVEAISRAGMTPGRDVALALDVASSHFYRAGRYYLDRSANTALSAEEMIDVVDGWVRDFPICSVEDALAEDDWENWPMLTSRIGARALVLGDDLLTTNPDRIRRAVDARAATALLLKVNQIGTLTEARQARALAEAAGWAVSISARSGETEDDWLADLAVGWRGDQIKVGSIHRSERLAKYNRLLDIEASTGLPLNPWPAGDSSNPDRGEVA